MQLTVNKNRLIFIILFIVNAAILYGTYSQQTHFIGNVTTNDVEKTVRTTQFFDKMHVRMTKYPFSGNKSYDETFSFEPHLHNGNILFNDKSNLNTIYFRYYKINDDCSLIFKHPNKIAMKYMSLACRY
ncbi:hypothetical protein ACFFLZ_04425 [Photobacterium aphoticum]|uniref:Uncharacterized protein n=1 Tax=Photobacterium aphoticum TaxID=754436 RepID=A0A0J1GQL2_9GAMM|nr:hypothetical protein [Photobacterium aphoticum]KLV01689.1 hypothetical protein ABT58_04330 [Photobacterium aphoticum]PSU59262.1 hypothetical protein C9I90_04095 [Photobacterium aphoticum]GHA31416.1 hypothetical protein GCM10007086_00660 [Photobacterium aphoticum]